MSNYEFNEDTLDRFLYWMKERYAIHNKRQQGEPAPWTEDPVLQTEFFTNPYREHDKTTVWFRENIRDPMAEDDEVIFATLLFRWFNSIPTGEFLLSYAEERWGNPLAFMDPEFFLKNHKGLKRRLDQRQEAGERLFGGAYIIKLENGKSKHHSVIDTLCQLIRHEWTDILETFRTVPTMEGCHARLCKIKYLGPFMAYEVICDLRYTWALRESEDICLWANPGPGAFRGLRRLLGMSVDKRQDKSVPGGKQAAIAMMQQLWKTARKRIGFGLKRPRGLPNIEMREIEHSLCEFDKYERARTGKGGRMKRKFTKGTGDAINRSHSPDKS